MTDSPFDYDPPKLAYEPIYEEVTKTRPTGEQYQEKVVVGMKVDPPPNLTAPNLEQLRYCAALIEVRTGLKVRVAPKMVTIKTPVTDAGIPDDAAEVYEEEEHEFYEVLTDTATGGPAAFEVTWSWLSGFEVGNHETLKNSRVTTGRK